MKTNTIYSIMLFIVCSVVAYNPVHDRELCIILALSLWGTVALYVALYKNRYIRVPNHPAILCVLLYGITVTISYLSTVGSSMNYRPFITQIIGIAVFSVAYAFLNKLYYSPIQISLLLSGVFTAGYFMVCYYNGGITGYFNFILSHKNIAGMFWGMCLLSSYRLSWKKNKIQWLYLAALIFLFWGVFISASRGALICTILLSLVYGLYTKRHIVTLLAAVFVVLTLIPISSFNPTGAGIHILVKSDDITNGRVGITWPKMLKIVKENPFVGCGIGNMYAPAVPNNAGPHNIYLFIHSCGGIFALFFWLFPVLYALFKIKNTNTIFGFKMALCLYLCYGFFSEMAANSIVCITVYWTLISILLLRAGTLDIVITMDKYIKRFIIIIAVIISVTCIKKAFDHYYVNMSIISANSKDPETAVKFIDYALQLEPRNYKALYIRGISLINCSYLMQGCVDLEILDRLVPDFAYTRVVLDNCYKQMAGEIK